MITYPLTGSQPNKKLLKPLIEFFGIPLVYNYKITDAELARSFFNTEHAQGHMEFTGYFSLMAQYRELTNQKGAFNLSEQEIGVMRELSPDNPTNSAVMKLARKRFLEFTSSVKQFPSNFSRKRAFQNKNDIHCLPNTSERS